MDVSIIQTLLKLGPIPILIIALNGFMWLCKKIKVLPAGTYWMIPWLCVILSTWITPMLLATGEFAYDIPSPKTAQHLLGFCFGLSAVGSHQWVMTTLRKIGFFRDDDTGA